MRWFKSYLHNRKQYITFNNKFNAFENKKIIYAIDLSNVSKLLDPTIIPNETNLFFTYHHIKILFDAISYEPSKTIQSFMANRLSLNPRNIKYKFFHKNLAKDKTARSSNI